jgi:hypothetical protein
VKMEARHSLPGPRYLLCQFTMTALLAVVVWISSSQIAGAFERNFVLWHRAACLRLCCRLKMASSLRCDFIGRVGIGTANWVDHMTQIGFANNLFSESICAIGKLEPFVKVL